MVKFYFNFRSTGGVSGSPHPTNQFRLAADIVDQLHFENVRRQNDGKPFLAVAFPVLALGDRDPMAVVRVFGSDRDALTRFRVHAIEALGLDQGRGMTVGEVTEAPEGCSFSAFVRDRSGDRETIGFVERSLRRAQRKAVTRLQAGEELIKPPKDMVERTQAIAKRREASVGACRAHLRVQSKSTGQSFSLFVTAVAVERSSETAVDIYGLSRKSAPFAVPHF